MKTKLSEDSSKTGVTQETLIKALTDFIENDYRISTINYRVARNFASSYFCGFFFPQSAKTGPSKTISRLSFLRKNLFRHFSPTLLFPPKCKELAMKTLSGRFVNPEIADEVVDIDCGLGNDSDNE